MSAAAVCVLSCMAAVAVGATQLYKKEQWFYPELPGNGDFVTCSTGVFKSCDRALRNWLAMHSGEAHHLLSWRGAETGVNQGSGSESAANKSARQGLFGLPRAACFGGRFVCRGLGIEAWHPATALQSFIRLQSSVMAIPDQVPVG